MKIRALLSRLFPYAVRFWLVRRMLPAGWRNSIADVLRVVPGGTPRSRCSDLTENKYNLRRLTHILEKGLYHPQWEPGHSKSIEKETRNVHEILAQSVPQSDPTLKWAREILAEYQEAQNSGVNKRLSAENAADSKVETDIDIFVRSRRSIRNYQDRCVLRRDLEEVVAAVNWCPTSCNRQSAVVYASLDADVIGKIATCFAGSTGFTRNVPAALVFCSDLRAYTMPMELYLPAIDVALGMQNCALVAWGKGLSITYLSWAQHNEEDEKLLREVLSIPEEHQIIAGSFMGYPAVRATPPARKSIDETLIIR